ncbi:MAG: gliding motility-associated C-terminal domain-containing protein [Bacteroidales bacterium]|jgi:gliding motility-associated-like protein|nr:gliding motility-associated C-terminal domain-containing protein [Bacteroidales bacterium]
MKRLICLGIVIITLCGTETYSQSYLLNATNHNTIKTTCSGYFYDNNSTGNYQNNQDRWITFCPTNPALQRIELHFDEFSLHSSDTMYLFSGTGITGTSLILFDNDGVAIPLTNTALYGKSMMPLNTETSGCITARFKADASGVSSGWKAKVQCVNRCQYPVSALDTFFVKYTSKGDSIVRNVGHYIDTVWNTAHTSYSIVPFDAIDICEGDSVLLIANPSFPESSLPGAYYQNDNMCVYNWDWGDGSGDTIPFDVFAGHLYTNFFGYNINLSVTDTTNGGCTSRNYNEIRVRMAKNPITALTFPDACGGDTISLSIGYNAQATIRVDSSGFDRVATQRNHDRVFIPDGPPCSGANIACYEAPVVFDDFLPNATLTDVNDLLSICINMEHSFLGDLGFFIICPNGQQVTLKYNMMDVSWYLGQPLDGSPYDSYSSPCDSNSNPYGVGWNYCFSNIYLTNQRGCLGSSGSSPLTASDTTNHSGYFQTPRQTGGANKVVDLNGFSPLIGCPLNGQWTLKICDNWGADNGWVFGWDLNLSNSLSSGNWEYSVPVDTTIWEGSYTYASDSLSTFVIFPPDANGYYPYDISIVDVFGCVWDTSIQVQVFPSYDTTISATICSGVYNGFGFSEDSTGTYVHSFQTTHGCDSVLTLNLSIAPRYDTTIYAEICNGSTYDSNGFLETLAGSYVHNDTSEYGCDSIIHLVLAVNDVYMGEIFDTVCQGEHYTQYGFEADSSGTYFQYLQTEKGCDSTIILHLYVYPSYNITHEAILCEGERYEQYGFSADSTGIYVQSLFTEKGCDSTITLYLVVNQKYEYTINASICEGSVYSNNDFYVANAGLYTKNLQTAAGCDSIVHLNLNVNPVYDTSYQVIACDDEPLVICGRRIDSSGNYIFNLKTTEGCDSIINVSVTIINPMMRLLYERIYAVEFPVTLDASCDSCYDYLWSTGENTPQINVNEEGRYSVTAQSPCGELGMAVEVVFDMGKDNIFVPNAFTPDAYNNIIFKPYAVDNFEITFEVYNRYGALIFSSHDINKGWDGTFEGKPCPQGVYAYRLLYRNIDRPSAQQVKYGTVMLVR